MTTSLNQTLLKGEVLLLKDRATEMGTGLVVGGDVKAVYHDGVGYYMLGKQQTVVRADAQTGTWTRIEEASSRKDPVTQNVFGMWIDHGIRPVDAAYAYAVMPGVDRDKFASLNEAVPFQVVSNQVDVQAVAFPAQGIVQAAFFKAGALRVLDGLDVRVDAACLLLLRHRGEEWVVSVSDPTQKLSELHVTLGGSFVGEGVVADGASTGVTMNLPQDQWAGQTVSLTLLKH